MVDDSPHAISFCLIPFCLGVAMLVLILSDERSLVLQLSRCISPPFHLKGSFQSGNYVRDGRRRRRARDRPLWYFLAHGDKWSMLDSIDITLASHGVNELPGY